MYRAVIFILVLYGIFATPRSGAAAQTEKRGDETSLRRNDKSQLELYGRGDLDLIYTRRNEETPELAFDLWKGSRMGLRGRGYLGAGLAAIGHVESGFGTINGHFTLMQDKVFGRQAYLGLESGLGTVTFGRHYPVSDAVTSIVDIALPGTLSPYKSQFYWQIDRLENSLIYSSPVVNGFLARAGYAFGEKSGAPGSTTTTAGVLYSKPPVEAGMSLESWRTSSFGASSAFYNFWNLAASYDFGSVAIVAGFSSDDLNLDISADRTAVSSRTYALGAKIPTGTTGRVVILLQLVTPEKGKVLEVGTVRYAYPVSKIVELYSQLNMANNAAAAAYGVKTEVLVGAYCRFNYIFWNK